VSDEVTAVQPGPPVMLNCASNQTSFESTAWPSLVLTWIVGSPVVVVCSGAW
jgi:hypothetical protein